MVFCKYCICLHGRMVTILAFIYVSVLCIILCLPLGIISCIFLFRETTFMNKTSKEILFLWSGKRWSIMFGLSICLVYYAQASLSVVFGHWMAVVFWLIIDLANYVKTFTSWAGTFPVKVFFIDNWPLCCA